jgi:glycosyltransferase-like protein
MKPLRIAMLAHSTNPRGGVVHAMELSAALHRLGHSVVLHAPDPSGRGFFRRGDYEQRPITCGPAPANTHAMVLQRIEDYIAHFSRNAAHRDFDIFHAHDGISGNALATLTERGLIPGYLRTVHHMDTFADARLDQLQLRSVTEAERVLCVSRTWERQLATVYGIHATTVPTGVDNRRFSPQPSAQDEALRNKLGLRSDNAVFLSVGGVEPRKNTLNILQAFANFHTATPRSHLIIAGGETLLDHTGYVDSFQAALRATNLKIGQDVILAGPIADDDMPSLFRIANALVFASLKEGFGLVVLEALSSGTPVILSRVEPFTEYMTSDACVWIDPLDVASIANGMQIAMDAATKARLQHSGLSLVTSFTWERSAHAHEAHYTLAPATTMRSDSPQPVSQGNLHA